MTQAVNLSNLSPIVCPNLPHPKHISKILRSHWLPQTTLVNKAISSTLCFHLNISFPTLDLSSSLSPHPSPISRPYPISAFLTTLHSLSLPFHLVVIMQNTAAFHPPVLIYEGWNETRYGSDVIYSHPNLDFSSLPEGFFVNMSERDRALELTWLHGLANLGNTNSEIIIPATAYGKWGRDLLRNLASRLE